MTANTIRRRRSGDARNGRSHRPAHLANVDFRTNRHNLYIVVSAIALGAGLIPRVAPRWSREMPHAPHPLLESGIQLTAVGAVALDLYFNGNSSDGGDAVNAAKMAEAH